MAVLVRVLEWVAGGVEANRFRLNSDSDSDSDGNSDSDSAKPNYY